MFSSLPSAYQGLDPAPVWRAFALLNATPRPSGHEKSVRDAIIELARGYSLQSRTDARGNLVVRVPSRGASNAAQPIALQAHLDMVCQKRPEVAFDFERDAIAPRRDGDRIYASGTTLGADNGIGVAYLLALLEGAAPVHPPLELLFTVEEETGLYGAAHLDPALVFSRQLINLDSEEDGEITIGCAGGAGVTLRLPVEREEPTNDLHFGTLTVAGLAGGHSGIQIGQTLGNALKIAGEVLDALLDATPGMQLVSFDGGTAHNAIPRDCVAVVAAPSSELEAMASVWERVTNEVLTRWREAEPSLTLSKSSASRSPVLSAKDTRTVLSLVRELPHGVQTWSPRWEGKVQTSSNLAEVHTGEDEIELSVSNRSFVACDLAEMQEHCATLGKNAGARVEERDGYPGWEPREASPLRDQTAAAFANVYGQLPHIEVVHAGLECGLLSQKLPGLDAVSFGPTIRGAHTPEEWVSIGSTQRNWQVLVQLLEALARG